MSLQYFWLSNEQQIRLWLNRIWRPKGIIDKQDHSNASILYWNTATATIFSWAPFHSKSNRSNDFIGKPLEWSCLHNAPASFIIKDIPFHIKRWVSEICNLYVTLFGTILEPSHFGIDKISKAIPKANNISANKSHYVTHLVQNTIKHKHLEDTFTLNNPNGHKLL